MSQTTRMQILEKLRRRSENAGAEPKRKLIDPAVQWLGDERKAAIGALRRRVVERGPLILRGRPVKYEPSLLGPWRRPIWQATDYACGRGLVAMLPEWIAACEQHERRMPVEQKNWTHVRQCFGYERHDNPELVEPMNALVKGAYGQLLNYFHASLKLDRKEREGGKVRRMYGAAQRPLARVLASAEVSEATKQRLLQPKARLNPFALEQAVTRSLKAISAMCRHRN